MINILAQMAFELFSKMYLVYGGDTSTIFYKQIQIAFGWKSIYLLLTLVLSCILTINGTVSDFPHTYHHISLVQMAAWRGCLTVFCFVLSNDNTYMAHLYYETFFMTNHEGRFSTRVCLASFVDQSGHGNLEESLGSGSGSGSEIVVVEKSSQTDILNRVKELMPTFILLSRVMKLKSLFNLMNSAFFFILSLCWSQ